MMACMTVWFCCMILWGIGWRVLLYLPAGQYGGWFSCCNVTKRLGMQ